MYAYTFSKRTQHIVGVLDSEKDLENLPEFLKNDLEAMLPEKVYDASDDEELKIQKLFNAANQYWEFWSQDDKIHIDVDGDWKHDHIFCDNLMASLGYKKEDEYLLEPSEDDWYNARHIYSKIDT